MTRVYIYVCKLRRSWSKVGLYLKGLLSRQHDERCQIFRCCYCPAFERSSNSVTCDLRQLFSTSLAMDRDNGESGIPSYNLYPHSTVQVKNIARMIEFTSVPHSFYHRGGERVCERKLTIKLAIYTNYIYISFLIHSSLLLL